MRLRAKRASSKVTWERSPVRTDAVRALKVTTVFIATVILGGALLAPFGYWAVQALASITPTLDSLARQPFHRYVSRGMLVLALLGLRPWARAMGLAAAAELGWCGPSARHWRLLGRGFLWGFASLAVFAALAVLAGAKGTNFEHSAGEWAKRLISAALSGLVVAVLEETLFRGALFGGLRRGVSVPWAMVVSSVVFALLHFLDRRPEPPTAVGWASGLALLPRMVREIDDWRMFAAALGSLTVVGLFLCLAYQRTGNLFFSAGLHAGWVFWMKLTGFVTVAKPAAPGWLWGTGKLVDGGVTFGLLLVTFALYWRWGRSAAADTEEPRSHG